MGNLEKKDERYIKPRNIIISILYEFMPLLSKLKSIYVEKSFKFISNHILPTSFRSGSKPKLTLSDIDIWLCTKMRMTARLVITEITNMHMFISKRLLRMLYLICSLVNFIFVSPSARCVFLFGFENATFRILIRQFLPTFFLFLSLSRTCTKSRAGNRAFFRNDISIISDAKHCNGNT